MSAPRPAPFLPVCRPQLPPADEVARYLRLTDAVRQYTNRGPLVLQLEQRLAAAMRLPAHALRTASNGTSAIEIAVLARAGAATPDRPLALIPSYTFAATGLAAERLGYIPVFVDVDPDTWSMDHAAAARHPDLDRVGLILDVAPLGRLPNLDAAETLCRQTGIPVVIDAAASFESLLDAPRAASATVPVTLSFHATKTFSTGEGGAVIWDSASGAEALVRAANFGFNYSRRSEEGGTNAKMSEMSAAVGLAMLDSLARRRADYASTLDHWRAALAALPGRCHLAPDLASVYVIWQAPGARDLTRAQEALTAAGIDSRQWYEKGLHTMPHFQRRSGRPAPLPVTEDLGARLLGLPMAHDLDPAAMARIAAVIRSSLG
ncbi:MAG: DegT/DnrJ/EryC1/StrS family aminotransferase [Paracoccaceae bacterium]